jgi:modulator of FtsH protease
LRIERYAGTDKEGYSLMEYAYRAEAWQALYTAVAGSAAALTGLLFVALSLNLRAILTSPEHRARARETFGGLLSLLVLSVLLLIPGQDRRVLGVELIGGSLVLLLSAMSLQFQTLRTMAFERRVRWVLRLAIFNLGTVTALVAGMSLVVGRFGGLFWLVPTVLISLLWSLSSAWLLVAQVAKEGA